jgi:hypothetical protein
MEASIGDNGLPVFDSEQEFQDYLEQKFEAAGFTALQEVSPHNSRYRADLLLIHDDLGKIGLELKRLTGGADAGRAHQQIVRQYSGRQYLGDEVRLWAFAPYIPKLQHDEMVDNRNASFQQGKLEVLEHFFQQYGIGVLNVHDRAYARLKWGSNRPYMVSAFGMARDPGSMNYDAKAIRDRVDERLYADSSV